MNPDEINATLSSFLGLDFKKMLFQSPNKLFRRLQKTLCKCRLDFENHKSKKEILREGRYVVK